MAKQKQIEDKQKSMEEKEAELKSGLELDEALMKHYSQFLQVQKTFEADMKLFK